MRERMAEWLKKMGLLQEEDSEKEPQKDEGPESPEIEFHALDPKQAAALGEGAALICPVTRTALQQNSLYYLCRDCNTAYSREGWDFLREHDKGRCCHCRHTGSVVLVAGGKAA